MFRFRLLLCFFAFVFTCFKHVFGWVWIVFKMFFRYFFVDCFWFHLGYCWFCSVVFCMLVAWVLGVALCCVKMLKVVFFCVSRCLFLSGCFCFSKLFRLPQTISGYWKFLLVM